VEIEIGILKQQHSHHARQTLYMIACFDHYFGRMTINTSIQKLQSRPLIHFILIRVVWLQNRDH